MAARLLALLAAVRVFVMRCEEAEGVVPPVVAQALLEQMRVVHELVHGQQLERGDAELSQVVDERRVGDARVGAAQVCRHVGIHHRVALEVGLDDHGVAPRRARVAAGRSLTLADGERAKADETDFAALLERARDRVESGAVQLSATSVNGREAVLGVVEGGRWFGELTVFIEAPRVHDAKALTDAELLVVSARRLQDIVNKRPEYLLEFLRTLKAKTPAGMTGYSTSSSRPTAT